MLLMSKKRLVAESPIDLESLGPMLPQQELLLGAGARLKYRGRLSGPNRDGDPNTPSLVGTYR